MKSRRLIEVLGRSAPTESNQTSAGDRILERAGLSGFVRQEKVVKAPQTDRWELLDSPRCLRRRYTFKHPSQVSGFIQELLEHQEDTQHHGRITIEDTRTVMVEVSTRDLDDVTIMDKEYAGAADLIYKDVTDARRKIFNDFGQ